MAEAGSVGVILPTTAYILRLKPPPVRAMLDHGMIVALGSDFNPNAHCVSLPMVMHLACVNLRRDISRLCSHWSSFYITGLSFVESFIVKKYFQTQSQ